MDYAERARDLVNAMGIEDYDTFIRRTIARALEQADLEAESDRLGAVIDVCEQLYKEPGGYLAGEFRGDLDDLRARLAELEKQNGTE